MPGPSLIQQQVDALRDLARLAAERAKREFKLEQDFSKTQASAEKQYQATRQGIVRRNDMQIQAIEGEGAAGPHRMIAQQDLGSRECKHFAALPWVRC